jgi:hypothetical protein
MSAPEREATLRAEREDLAAERDTKPDDPPWLAPERAGEPLWRGCGFLAGGGGDCRRPRRKTRQR